MRSASILQRNQRRDDTLKSGVELTLREFVRSEAKTLPLPGAGETRRRFEVLASWAAVDLSVGRLAEGHSDAIAILAEAGMEPQNPDATYGVWAARMRQGGVTATSTNDGWLLSGSKPFCSGSNTLDRALVVAETVQGSRIFDVAVHQQVVSVHPESWAAVGMADSNSTTLDFGGPPIPSDQVVGPANFYTSRCGFWFGAAGVAACWYGGAVGLVQALLESIGDDPNGHVLSDLGVAIAGVQCMHDVLHEVADQIDRNPRDSSDHARFSALVARQVIHDRALDVLNLVGAAGGARPLCLDRAQSRRAADLFVYLSQHHGGSDSADIGRLAKEEWDAANR